MADNPSFESRAQEVISIIESRRSSWTYLSLMEWNDVSAILRERVWRKWHLYDPSKPLENWVNTLISRALMNLRRDLVLRLSRPCIGGWNAKGKTCVHNLGGDSCEITSSHKQCAQCPIYADWQKAREHQLNIKSTVALEHHAQEVSNMPGHFIDAEAIKQELDSKMKAELTSWEWRIYRLVYVENLSPTAASARLESMVKTWKRAPRADEQTTYQAVLQKTRWLKEMMLTILRREGHL